jgi:hypothetical protein
MSRILINHRNVRLFLYGTGEPSPKVLGSFPEEVRDRVTAHSHLTGPEIADGLAKASIFFFPTQYEGFGMALSEAMACGCAPVTTPTGFGANLRHGEEALICDFNDTDAMERSVLRLLNDEGLRTRIARNAWERVRGLTWKANIARLEALYMQWVSEHRASQATSADPAGTPLELFTGTAGVRPATSTSRCEDVAQVATSNNLFALRAHGGRAAGGPSEELG